MKNIAAALALLLVAFSASAQVGTLWYKEVAYEGRIYVFNDPNQWKAWEASREMGKSITKIGYGPNGETVVFDSDNAMDLYNLRHGHDADAREYTPPKAPTFPPPTVLKIGDAGEVRLSALLQAWYVTDDTAPSTGTSYYGNTTGLNTFRLRRAEIRILGKITPAWAFDVMFDPAKSQNFAGGQDEKILQDLSIAYLGLKDHEFALGQRKIVITEEGVHSSSDLDFAERARVTRGFSDRRETGFFYKGELSPMFTAWVSITNGTASNVVDDSNDTLFGAARLDVKPIKGLLAGVSGGTSGGEGRDHRTRDRYGAHVRYDGPDSLPIGLRFEYLYANDGQGAGKADLKRDGFYLTGLYTYKNQFRFGLRYDVIDNNRDVSNQKIKTFTAGFHYLPKGRFLNIKLDCAFVKQEGRVVNGALDESFHQFVLAAQAAF